MQLLHSPIKPNSETKISLAAHFSVSTHTNLCNSAYLHKQDTSSNTCTIALPTFTSPEAFTSRIIQSANLNRFRKAKLFNKYRKKAPSRLWWMNQPKHAVNIIRVGDEWIYYHARHKFSSPASQLVCLPAYQPACLITCPHTEHLLSRLKGDGWGRMKYYFFSREFILKRRCVGFFAVPQSFTASLPNCPDSFYYPLWQAVFLCTCLLKCPSYL